jgi:hypothetical protein
METSQNGFNIYYHSPCFDGAVSAALASQYIEDVKSSRIAGLGGVNYDRKAEWLAWRPPKPFAVVDFLYHPAADLWADHHPTTFLTDEMRIKFEAQTSPNLIYDRTATSCSILLWNKWKDLLKNQNLFEELVYWADRIDSARYDSVDEAIALPSPALQINLALGISREEEFSKRLVTLFRTHTLHEIAARPEIQQLFVQGYTRQQNGLERLKSTIKINPGGIAVFDVNAAGVLVNRYAPFHFFPDARYSAGIVRGESDAKLTVMRNPWREFPSAPLGRICATFGGGGHQRVGSIFLPVGRRSEASSILTKLVQQITDWEKQQNEEVL